MSCTAQPWRRTDSAWLVRCEEKETMSLELLRAIARCDLPVSFTDAAAIEGLRALKASGYVVGMTSEPGSDAPHGRVSIITHSSQRASAGVGATAPHSPAIGPQLRRPTGG